MKIVHICLACFFPDNYSYQENLLPKFHKKMGYDVEVIASLQTFDENGKITYLKFSEPYYNENNIKVTRLRYKSSSKIYHILRKYNGLYDALNKANPDILFIHGVQFMDINIIRNYAKEHTNLTIFIDNHADFSNSAKTFISKVILHRLIWRHYAHKIEPYVKKFYGVLPARVEFLKKVYGLPEDKVSLLVMGVDDELCDSVKQNNYRYILRKQYNIKDDDFLIITGGKIDLYKTQVLLLMQAIKSINVNRIKLLVFGSVVTELKKDFTSLVDNQKIIYVGWLNSERIYQFLSMGDLAVFPGRHSVLWEQAAGMGIPMIVKYWEGTTHVDLGGNVIYIEKDSIEEIKKIINTIYNDKYLYKTMKEKDKYGEEYFSYYNIAKRSIGYDEL